MKAKNITSSELMTAQIHAKKLAELANDIGVRTFDQTAATILELLKATKRDRAGLERLVRKQVEDGKWEQVWKRIPGHRRAMAAYREKK